VTEDTKKKELWVHFLGGPCPHNKGQSFMTAINIKCGNTLVSIGEERIGEEQIEFKVLLLVFTCLGNSGPDDLGSLIEIYQPR
jgi:hypothetical protein